MSYNHPAHARAILDILVVEQDNFCAYTEEHISPGFTCDVEHFNPTVKGTLKDNYLNWYAASSKLNRKKGSDARWKKFQPILHPTNVSLEKRIVYDAGYYISRNINDTRANNLTKFLLLNEMGLPQARINHIKTLEAILNMLGNDMIKFESFLKSNIELVKYRTAIKSVFGIVI